MYTVLLSCTHARGWRTMHGHPAPTERSDLWCHRCKNVRTVVAVTGPWKGQCQECWQFNVTRALQATVVDHAHRHVAKHPLHTVTVWKEGRKEGSLFTVTYESLPATLF